MKLTSKLYYTLEEDAENQYFTIVNISDSYTIISGYTKGPYKSDYSFDGGITWKSVSDIIQMNPN